MTALLIVDMQNDFMPKGALGVPEADQMIPLINRLMHCFSLVVATQDWHPADHQSFAISHPGKKPGEIVDVKGISQILWPVHCVRNTDGAELAPLIDKENIDCIFYKGTDRWIDSYSAFFDNAHLKSTGLHEYLASREIRDLYIAGVATDYCVLFSTLDALDLHLSVHVIVDACRGIDLRPGDVQDSLAMMREKGAILVSSEEVFKAFRFKRPLA